MMIKECHRKNLNRKNLIETYGMRKDLVSEKKKLNIAYNKMIQKKMINCDDITKKNRKKNII